LSTELGLFDTGARVLYFCNIAQDVTTNDYNIFQPGSQAA